MVSTPPTPIVKASTLPLKPPAQGPPANKPPVANFVFGPSSPRVEDQVQFASSSFDPEGKLSEQRWDLDGDGQFDDARGDEVVWTFTSPGEHKVLIELVDANHEVFSGQSKTVKFTVPGAASPRH